MLLMVDLTFTIEHDEDVKIIHKSQLEINKDFIAGGGVIVPGKTVGAITKPYVSCELTPRDVQTSKDRTQHSFKSLHIKLIFRQEIAFSNGLSSCAYVVFYQHEQEHVKDNIVIFNNFDQTLKENKKLMKLFDLLSKWNDKGKIKYINHEVRQEIHSMFIIETTEMAKSLDTTDTYSKLDEDINTVCHLYNIPSLILGPLPDFLTFGILSKGKGKRGGTDPRSNRGH